MTRIFLLRWTSIILVHVLHTMCIFNRVVRSFVIDYEDSNIIDQKLDSYESKYKMEQKEKGDEPKDTSPSEQKFITDTLQKERTGMIFISTYSLYIRQMVNVRATKENLKYNILYFLITIYKNYKSQ